MNIEYMAVSLPKNFILGFTQILLWGGSFFLLAILAKPIVAETGWSHQLVYGALSLAMLVSGMLASKVGKMIDTIARNYNLLYAGFVMGAGLIIIGLSRHFLLFLLGWCVVGVAMAMGLYDALFATLGKKYGKIARKSIVQVTLISGFTTTVVWPLLSFLLNHYGWRNACFVYAGILIVWVFPVHKFLIPEKVQMIEEENASTTIQQELPTGLENTSVFTILLVNFTIGSILMTGISVHLVEILDDNGLPLTMAISVGAMLGPSQVGIRFLDAILPKKTPLNSALVSSVTIFVGLILFLMHHQISFLAVICFGLGNGMRSILRGTLPLWIFGADSYATIMGRLAGLPMVAQALTPLLSGYMIAHFSVKKFVGLLVVLAFVNIITMVVLRNKILNKSRVLSA
ncbi:MFS transporter [Flectobacillus roseus]|uniref:MFS transporter n=1 Tax=Flectobacillus roseus TaxID=502259 RepID=UPI0024B7AC72|nr:MFS transporter [Flectobacillus roseus]MDI9871158.1 MFS transporter [Flectobacillus roseus]